MPTGSRAPVEPQATLRRLNPFAASAAAIGLLVVCGCAPMAVDRAGASPATTLRATSTQHWSAYARMLVARNPSAPAPRLFAYLALAQRNAAVVAAQGRRDVDGAVAGASAAMLTFFIPSATQAIDTQLARETAALGNGRPRAEFAVGVEVGTRAAQDVIAAAKTDGTDIAWSGVAPTARTAWASQASPPAPPQYTEFVGWQPFYLSTSGEFRAPPPPAIDSAEFRDEAAQVRRISDNRSAEQLRIAQYWELVTGAYFPGWWNETALAAAEAHGLSQQETLDLLAMLHMAWVDAFSACADSKYVYWVPRPTQVDPEIRLAIGLPNHPSYPSNHSCTSAAAATVLDARLPDRNKQYSALAKEVAMSRVYGGIHYPIDTTAGLEIGRKVGEKVLAKGLPPGLTWIPPRR